MFRPAIINMWRTLSKQPEVMT